MSVGSGEDRSAAGIELIACERELPRALLRQRADARNDAGVGGRNIVGSDQQAAVVGEIAAGEILRFLVATV